MGNLNKNANQSMDFSSASAIIGGLDSFLEAGVSFDTPEGSETSHDNKDDKGDEGDGTNPSSSNPTPPSDLSSFLEGGFGNQNTNDDSDEDKGGDEDEGTNPVSNEDEGEDNPSTPEPSESVYKDIIRNLIDNKLFDGFDTILIDDKEIPFDEFEINEENFVDIIKSKFEELKEQAIDSTTKGLSDFTKHLLEIEKNGGNVSQALETYQNFQEPLDNFDLTNEIDQQKVIFMKYHQIMGMEKDVVIDLIEGLVKKGKLEDEASKADAELRAAVSKQMDALNQQAVADKEKRKEQLKSYKSSLRESLNKFDLNDSYKKKIIDIATKEGDNGNFPLDDLYYEIRNNPEKAADLVLFLTNAEEYKKQISNDQVRNNSMKTLKQLKLVNRGGSDIKITDKSKVDVRKNKDLVDIKDIFGN